MITLFFPKNWDSVTVQKQADYYCRQFYHNGLFTDGIAQFRIIHRGWIIAGRSFTIEEQRFNNQMALIEC